MKPESPQLSGRLALTVPEAAAAIGVSERHLRSMLGEIPHLYLGGRVVIPVYAFREWLQQQAQHRVGRVDAAVEEIVRDLDSE